MERSTQPDKKKASVIYPGDFLAGLSVAMLAIPQAIVLLGQALNLHIVAEGVEVAAERDALAARGCNEFQGYFFARPMQAAAVGDYLQASVKRRAA